MKICISNALVDQLISKVLTLTICNHFL